MADCKLGADCMTANHNCHFLECLDRYNLCHNPDHCQYQGFGTPAEPETYCLKDEMIAELKEP